MFWTSPPVRFVHCVRCGPPFWTPASLILDTGVQHSVFTTLLAFNFLLPSSVLPHFGHRLPSFWTACRTICFGVLETEMYFSVPYFSRFSRFTLSTPARRATPILDIHSEIFRVSLSRTVLKPCLARRQKDTKNSQFYICVICGSLRDFRDPLSTTCFKFIKFSNNILDNLDSPAQNH